MYNKEYKKIYDLNHKPEIKKYRETHRLEQKEYMKKWYKNHKKVIKEYNKFRKPIVNEYNRNRRKVNINSRLASNFRNRIGLALNGNPKLSTTMKLVGCSIEHLKQHLEKQFKKGMSFSNYGKWHIDHIKPCASFDLNKKSEQCKCFNYTNLQPLWAKDNMSKSDKLSGV